MATRFLRQQVLPDIVVPQRIYVPNIGFVCYQQQTNEGVLLLPSIQDFHSYKLHNVFLLPQWTTPPNLKLMHLQIAMLQQYASVAMLKRFHNNLQHHGSFLVLATFVPNIKLIGFQMVKL